MQHFFSYLISYIKQNYKKDGLNLNFILLKKIYHIIFYENPKNKRGKAILVKKK